MRFIPAVSPVQIQVPLPDPKDGTRRLLGSPFRAFGPLGQHGPLVKWLRHRPFTAVTRVRVSYGSPYGGVAQPVEHLLHTQGVTDSSSVVSTKKDHTETVWSFFAHVGPPGVDGTAAPPLSSRGAHCAPALALCRNLWYFKGGAAQTAGGWPHHPRGGVAHAAHVTYRTVYRYDHREKQKPPPWPVTVSVALAI